MLNTTNKHLASTLRTKENASMYHRLTREVDEMEQGLANKYGTRGTLYFKQNNTSYQDMYRFICREARTLSNLLMVDCKSELEYVPKMGHLLHEQRKS